MMQFTLIYKNLICVPYRESQEDGRLIPSFKTNRQHVKYVKTIIANKTEQKFCPKCGSTMVLRKVKKGSNAGNEFWGCSKFPKRRGVINVT